MDALELLNNTRPAPSEVPSGTVAAATTRLLAAIEAEAEATRTRAPLAPVAAAPGGGLRPHSASTRRPPNARRRTRRAWTLLGAAAAAAAGLFVAQSLIPVGPSPAPPAAAAELLHRAADNAVRFADPPLRPGQYLRVQTTNTHVASVGVAEPKNGVMTENTYELRVRERQSTFIPEDRASPWTRIRPAMEFLGAAGSTTSADFARLKKDPQALGSAGLSTEYLSAREGHFNGDASPMMGSLSDLPKSPEALLQHIREITQGAGPDPDTETFVWIADRLRFGTADAETRALFFRTLALIPGCTVLDETVEQGGTHAVAVQAPREYGGARWQLLLDPENGRYLGEREVKGQGANTELVATTIVDTSIVDKVPSKQEATSSPAGG